MASAATAMLSGSQPITTRPRQRNNTPLSPRSPLYQYGRTSRSMSLTSTSRGSAATTPIVVQLPVHPAPSLPLPPTDERATILQERNDASVAQMIMALVHDCFVAIERLHRGLVPDDVFTLRFRLLSLYIVKEDVTTLGYEAALQEQGLQYRYQALINLLDLREKTLLASRKQRIIHSQTWGIEVRRELEGITRSVLSEPIVGDMTEQDASSYTELLLDVRACIAAAPDGPAPSEDRTTQVCNCIRAFFRLAPLSPSPPRLQLPSKLTFQRELAIIFDVFKAFSNIYTGATPIPDIKPAQLVSLEQDNRLSTYTASDQHAFHFILARDVLCGLIPGPCPLGVNGAWKQYISPMIDSWSAWQTQGFYEGPGTDVWETFTEALRHINAAFCSNLQKQ